MKYLHGDKEFDHARRVYSDITQLIASPENPTPLVRLNRINRSRDFVIYLKLERYNPFGSIKDRIASEMLKSLDVDGRKVVEPSSGNTGIALTCVANALGIPIEIAVPKGIPEEKKVMLKFLGARLWEADDALCPLFPTEGARGLVNALVNSPATKASYISPNQYENELNVQAHYRTTGPEIWQQTQGKITHFFAGFGTCGTITGVGRFLKAQNPAIKVIGVEPSSPNHRLPGMKRITGLADEFIPKILDRSVIDGTVEVSDQDAYRTAIDLARKDGIPVGPTTGAILWAALRLAQQERGLAVVISPDDAFKYTSFYKDILETEAKESAARECDLCDLVCPLSKIKATELIDSLDAGETVKIILGNTESLKSVAQELKARGIKPGFTQEGENRFILTVTR
ncbi:MAG: pyridoxal-phosphate dependent enzyme [Chloroflexota bacterium]|nr:pyridoxal-phosphate dependent enzyme [Chloroflexota bacterium]